MVLLLLSSLDRHTSADYGSQQRVGGIHWFTTIPVRVRSVFSAPRCWLASSSSVGGPGIVTHCRSSAILLTRLHNKRVSRPERASPPRHRDRAVTTRRKVPPRASVLRLRLPPATPAGRCPQPHAKTPSLPTPASGARRPAPFSNPLHAFLPAHLGPLHCHAPCR
ncbi:hypothetical protein chiPu_0027106 [Chiloscyllium punctatum]|uniref:Uncharacterized protein n=1 Tax=Chiloscyllium punctatum TaxID=137246 RepID=A0A401TJZ2_CHIPU|nr:hypothetical protein [Chiloscyllium punctatum]